MSEVLKADMEQKFSSKENRSVDKESIEYWRGLVEEISAERDHYKELAYTDEATGLPNRRYLREVVEPKLGSINSLFAIVDVNEFKVINDTHGHDKGDEALKAIAEVLQQSVRKDSDVVARIGGDEFAIIGSASFSTKEEQVVPSLRQRIDPKLKEASSKLGINLKVSLGAVVAREGEKVSYDEIYRRADQEMYKDKGVQKRKIL